MAITPGQEKSLVWFPRANKFVSWASKNGSLVVQWASEISSKNVQPQTTSELMTVRWENQRVESMNNLKSEHALLIFVACLLGKSYILVGATDNWNVLAY